MRKIFCEKSSFIGFLVVVILLVITTIISGVLPSVLSTSSSSHSKVFKVVIDAGHGGIDGGVNGKISGVKESDLNLDIAKKLKEQFEEVGIKVVMTRTSYGGLYGTTGKGFKMRDMKKREKIINSSSADLMLSVHLNYFSSPSRKGATVFFGEDKEGERLAKNIQKYFNEYINLERDFSPLQGDYYLLNVANCPSVICECGFLSNQEDEENLLKEEYREFIARQIFYGSISYLYGE